MKKDKFLKMLIFIVTIFSFVMFTGASAMEKLSNINNKKEKTEIMETKKIADEIKQEYKNKESCFLKYFYMKKIKFKTLEEEKKFREKDPLFSDENKELTKEEQKKVLQNFAILEKEILNKIKIFYGAKKYDTFIRFNTLLCEIKFYLDKVRFENRNIKIKHFNNFLLNMIEIDQNLNLN